MDNVKQEIRKASWKGILQVFLIGLIGYIMGVVSMFYIIFK
jgi:hypothetical protein